MKMKADQERVRTLLSDTVTLLCKSGLQYNSNLKVQGLLGITVDDSEVFIVHLDEVLKCEGGHESPRPSGTTDVDSAMSPPSSPSRKRKRRRRSSDKYDREDSFSREDSPSIKTEVDLSAVKVEAFDEDDVMITSEEGKPTLTSSTDFMVEDSAEGQEGLYITGMMKNTQVSSSKGHHSVSAAQGVPDTDGDGQDSSADNVIFKDEWLAEAFATEAIEFQQFGCKEAEDYLYAIYTYLDQGTYPKSFRRNENKKRALRRAAQLNYRIADGQLQHRKATGKTTEESNPWRAVILDESERLAIMKDLHLGPKGTHLGRERTRLKICTQYYWPNLTNDIKAFVQNCTICQGTNHLKGRRPARWQKE